MKRNLICLLMGILILVFANSLWAQCPEDTIDRGYCDTLHVVPRPYTDTCITYYYTNNGDPYTETHCINNPGEKFPCFLYVNLLVTHDSNTFWWGSASKWIQDSIVSFVIPLGWTRTNPAKYCSLSTYWNENVVDDDPEAEGYPYPRRIWRNFPPLGGDSINWMGKLKWPTAMLVDMSSDSVLYSGSWMVPPHVFITLIGAGSTKKKWSQERDTLLATLTFRVEDGMTICIDSTFYPPASNLTFTRYDAVGYVPRDKMPLGIRINGDGSVDTCQCPGTDVRWIDGSTEESKPTTFNLSQNYPNPFNPVTNFKFSLPQASHVKIEIFNILGQKVKTLVDEDMKAGSFVVDWNGKDQRGVEASSGIYFYRIVAGDFSSVKRMVLLK